MKKLILFAIMTISLTGCSSELAPPHTLQPEKTEAISSRPADTANTEAPKVKAQEETKVSASDLLAQKLEKLSEKFGPAVKDGDGFHFDKLANVTLFEEDGEVRRIIVRSGDVDVFGARVGQTPDEITKVMGDPELSGKDEESDGYISQYKVNSDTTALFVSDNDKNPTSTVLVSYSPITLHTDEPQAPTLQPQTPKEKVNVRAQFTGTYKDGVIIEVINAGMSPVKNVSVSLQVFGVNPLGKNTSRGTYAMVSRLEQGETKEIKVIVMSAEMRSITNVKINGVTAEAVQK